MKKRIILIVAISFFFITTFAQTPSWLWAKSIGGVKYDDACLTMDALGNIYVVVNSESPTITFDSITLTNSNILAIFLAKYDAKGNVIWAKDAANGTDWRDEAYSINTDPFGNIYIAGCFCSPTITFGSFTLTNTNAGNDSDDVFIAKYDANGNILWAKSAGGISYDGAGEVVVDNASGNVYVSGYFDSPSITFGSYTLTAGEHNFLVKYNSNGNVLWAKEGPFYEIALDASGNLYAVGSSSNHQSFLSKYDASGNLIWTKNTGGTGDYELYYATLDASGNVYLAGEFQDSSINFGSSTLTNAGDYDILLAKYDANGNILWVNSAGSTGPDYPNSIAVDASGNVYVAGGFDSPSLTFGTTTLTNTGNHIETDDIFIAEYTTDGNVLWAKSVGGDDIEDAWSINLDASGNIYIAGIFGSAVLNFGPNTILNNGEVKTSDAYIAKLGSPNAINEISNLPSLKIFPNPASNTLSINAPQHSAIGILNIHGKQIISIAVNANSNNKTIDISSLPSGIYFVKAITKKGVVTRKFIKK